MSATAEAILSGRRILITAHGNSLRALVKHLDGISDADVKEFERRGVEVLIAR